MNRAPSLAIAATILTATQASVGADADGYFRTVGVPSRGEFIASQQPHAAPSSGVQVGSWIAGYVSAYNADAPNTYDTLPGSGLDGARLSLKNYCDTHALDDLAKAVETSVEEAHPRRITHRPK